MDEDWWVCKKRVELAELEAEDLAEELELLKVSDHPLQHLDRGLTMKINRLKADEAAASPATA